MGMITTHIQTHDENYEVVLRVAHTAHVVYTSQSREAADSYKRFLDKHLYNLPSLYGKDS
jgi:hypothetical protein